MRIFTYITFQICLNTYLYVQEGMKKGNKDKLTVLIDKEIKDKYKEYCDSKGLILGKQIEIFMENELKNIKVKNAKK